MRTGRSLTVCCSLLPGGGLPGPGRGEFSLVREGGGGVCLVGGGSPWSWEGVVSAWSGGVLLGPGGCLPGPEGGSLETPPC